MKNAEGFKFMRGEKLKERQNHKNSDGYKTYEGGYSQQEEGGKKQNYQQPSEKPFSHLGATYGNEKQKVYRVKTLSYQ